MEIIIEQLGTSHNVIDRQRFNKSRIKIGRGYANDVILTDPHVDEFHASLERDEDGRWFLTDLNSVNGIKKRGSRGHQDRWQIESGDIFLIGRNRISILSTDHPVPAATRIRRSELFMLWLGNWPVLISLFLVYLGITAFVFYINVSSEIDWRDHVINQIWTTLGYVLLVVGVYFLSVLFKRSGHFLSHLGILILLAILVSLLGGVMKLLWFNTSSDMDSTLKFSQAVIDRGALFVYFWCVLYLAFHITFKWRTVISAGLISLIILTTYIQSKQWEEFLPAGIVEADLTMLPPGFLWREAVPQTDYFDKAFGVVEAVEKNRQKKLKEKPGNQVPELKSPDELARVPTHSR